MIGVAHGRPATLKALALCLVRALSLKRLAKHSRGGVAGDARASYLGARGGVSQLLAPNMC